MNALKVTMVGNSAGIVLPKDLPAKPNVKKGDTLHAVETPHGIA